MNRIIYLLICTVLTSSCSHHASAPDETQQIYERLHGKYKAVSAVGSEAADVNLDGTATKDMLSELPELASCDLEIRIVAKNNFLLAQFWPEQFVGYGVEPTGYDPSLVVNYARQAMTHTFSLDVSGNSLQVNGGDAVVTIEGKDTIKVVISKKLYTSTGWKTISITGVYHRYTMRT